MSILFWILVAHTGIWALGAFIANLFSPNLWSETTMRDKFIGYLTAEGQLWRALSTIIKHRKRLLEIRAKKRKDRKQPGECDD